MYKTGTEGRRTGSTAGRRRRGSRGGVRGLGDALGRFVVLGRSVVSVRIERHVGSTRRLRLTCWRAGHAEQAGRLALCGVSWAHHLHVSERCPGRQRAAEPTSRSTKHAPRWWDGGSRAACAPWAAPRARQTPPRPARPRRSPRSRRRSVDAARRRSRHSRQSTRPTSCRRRGLSVQSAPTQKCTKQCAACYSTLASVRRVGLSDARMDMHSVRQPPSTARMQNPQASPRPDSAMPSGRLGAAARLESAAPSDSTPTRRASGPRRRSWARC